MTTSVTSVRKRISVKRGSLEERGNLAEQVRDHDARGHNGPGTREEEQVVYDVVQRVDACDHFPDDLGLPTTAAILPSCTSAVCARSASSDFFRSVMSYRTAMY